MLKNGIFYPRSIGLLAEGDDNTGGGTDLGKVLESFNARLAKHTDATQLAQQLFTENFTLREDKRKLNSRLEAAQGKVPADGALVLTADEAKAWTAIKELSLSPDEIKAKLQSSSESEKELSSLKRKDLMREVGDVEGYKPTVLSTLIAANIPVQIKEIEKDGKKHRAAFVTVKENGADKEVALSDYVQTNHADFLPALRVEQKPDNKFVRQESPGRAPSANRYDQIREEQKQRQEAQKTDKKPLEQRLGMVS
jgi:hypothetical protein